MIGKPFFVQDKLHTLDVVAQNPVVRDTGERKQPTSTDLQQ
jgi:hypothetical protein